ncbi:MAG TPA: hypothetical protein DER11_05185 [Janibacter terrae]|nr:hypothetical protein [Janibacter terrae]
MSRSVRLVGAALIPAFTLPIATSAVARSADVPPPPVNRNLPKELDVASPYIPQSVCDPDPKPGVTAFARLMANHYDEFNYGISRACNYGLTEHSEGRALDWMLNAYDPHERAVADGVIAWLLAPDSEGRPAAMARRFGVMYIIWNRQIWGTYQMSTGWRAYNGVSPHTDHIHFSFSWDGAMQRTSWWTGKAWTGVTTTPGGPSMPIPDPTEYPTLRVGSSGPDVKLAQEVIGVTADGAFGPATQTALKTWQRTNGVKVTGVLDDATWNRMVLLGKIPARGSDQGGDLAPHMKTSIRLGSTGEAVKALQRVLGLKVDGTFGPATNTAVRNFQKDRQLRVDGFVTQNVWKALAGVPYVKNGTVPKPKPKPEPVAQTATDTEETAQEPPAEEAPVEETPVEEAPQEQPEADPETQTADEESQAPQTGSVTTSNYASEAAGLGLGPNAQKVYSAVRTQFPDMTDIGGYRAGDPGDHGSGRAVDIMVTGARGDQVNAWLQQHAGELNITYIIWQQRIWYPNGSSNMMEDRGDPTQNHYDHVHVSVG